MKSWQILLQGGSQFWRHVGNCFLDLLSIALVIILNGLPGGPWPSAQLLEREFVPAHLWIEEINTPFLPEAGHSLERFCKTEDPFAFLSHCLSLPIPPFDFGSSLLLSLWFIKEPGSQTPIRCWFWGASLPSSQSAGSQIKVSSLPQHLVSRIHWLILWQAERTWTW